MWRDMRRSPRTARRERECVVEGEERRGEKERRGQREGWVGGCDHRLGEGCRAPPPPRCRGSRRDRINQSINQSINQINQLPRTSASEMPRVATRSLAYTACSWPWEGSAACATRLPRPPVLPRLGEGASGGVGLASWARRASERSRVKDVSSCAEGIEPARDREGIGRSSEGVGRSREGIGRSRKESERSRTGVGEESRPRSAAFSRTLRALCTVRCARWEGARRGVTCLHDLKHVALDHAERCDELVEAQRAVAVRVHLAPNQEETRGNQRESEGIRGKERESRGNQEG